MYYADWLSDGMAYWGEKVWIFLHDLPPTEWVEGAEYNLKILLYLSPIIIFHLVLFIIMRVRAGRREDKLMERFKLAKLSYVCPHCNYIPEYAPKTGVFFCPKCGKMSHV